MYDGRNHQPALNWAFELCGPKRNAEPAPDGDFGQNTLKAVRDFQAATLVTASVCPVSGIPIEVPVSAFHSRTVLSSPPETIAWPSGLIAMLLTASVCR